MQNFTPEQWAKFQTWLDRIYDDFTAKVGEGRNMSQADVHEIAKGRIWTGEDAKERGLVDELGGLKTAMRLIREAWNWKPMLLSTSWYFRKKRR